MSDDEYRWEPVAGCWNVRPDRSSPSGWAVDYPEVDPEPAPFTTIAWRMLHISDGNTIYWEHAFGVGSRHFTDLAPHGDAAGAIDYLADSQRPVTATLADIDDEQLDGLRPTPLGESWPAGQILAVLLDEQVHHGAEIALLRDLYRARPSAPTRRWTRPPISVASGAVDRLAQKVGVAAMAGVLLDHVHQDPAQTVGAPLPTLDVVQRGQGNVAVGHLDLRPEACPAPRPPWPRAGNGSHRRRRRAGWAAP